MVITLETINNFKKGHQLQKKVNNCEKGQQLQKRSTIYIFLNRQEFGERSTISEKGQNFRKMSKFLKKVKFFENVNNLEIWSTILKKVNNFKKGQ